MRLVSPLCACTKTHMISAPAGAHNATGVSGLAAAGNAGAEQPRGTAAATARAEQGARGGAGGRAADAEEGEGRGEEKVANVVLWGIAGSGRRSYRCETPRTIPSRSWQRPSNHMAPWKLDCHEHNVCCRCRRPRTVLRSWPRHSDQFGFMKARLSQAQCMLQ
eukprot:scaffold137509_cov17-Tisochrysis_lutea.AAC.1